jgi:GTP-binding protein HflX
MKEKFYSTAVNKERAILVGVATPDISTRTAEQHVQELGSLLTTAGGNTIETVIQRRAAFDGSTLIGKGKLGDIASRVSELDIDLVLFDDDLTPSQVKKVESILGCKVMDRSGIILDIFASNAQTAEAKISVEVAQLEYYLPRLTRLWTHLSRQVGGIGTRGPGETQLEVDRRLMRNRISELKKRLKKNQAIRKRQNNKRQSAFHAALVGYTNTGKSSLMNLLTDADVLVANKLFATLDATTRKWVLGDKRGAVLSDTVGFIRKLPHNLVESFKSTLSVVEEASLVLNIIDASDTDFESHMEVTAKVLKELDTESIPRLTVFNKIDTIDRNRLDNLKANYPDALFISVLEKVGIEELKSKVLSFFDQHLERLQATWDTPPKKEW